MDIYGGQLEFEPKRNLVSEPKDAGLCSQTFMGPFSNSGFKTGARQNRVVQFRKRPICQIWMLFGRAGFETGVTERALLAQSANH
jgi:hypothetical protein